MRITVNRGEVVTVTVPRGMSVQKAEAFVWARAAWIRRAVLRAREATSLLPYAWPARREYLAHKREAEASTRARVARIAAGYQSGASRGLTYGEVMVRNQKSLWGSCSRQRNLSFNFRIIFLPPAAQDYIVAHELSHLAHFNHSAKFWAMVAEAVPNYKEIRKELRGKWRLG
jgi:predicted metal-dependent hydrolase